MNLIQEWGLLIGLILIAIPLIFWYDKSKKKAIKEQHEIDQLKEDIDIWLDTLNKGAYHFKSIDVKYNKDHPWARVSIATKTKEQREKLEKAEITKLKSQWIEHIEIHYRGTLEESEEIDKKKLENNLERYEAGIISRNECADYILQSNEYGDWARKVIVEEFVKMKKTIKDREI